MKFNFVRPDALEIVGVFDAKMVKFQVAVAVGSTLPHNVIYYANYLALKVKNKGEDDFIVLKNRITGDDSDKHLARMIDIVGEDMGLVKDISLAQ